MSLEISNNTGNHLFPVFVKLERLRLLIVGGGRVCIEKMQAVLQNSPATAITVVATTIDPAVRALAQTHPNIRVLERPYHHSDLEYADIAIVAVNDPSVSQTVARQARIKGVLVNVADTPELCDFYLSSIVRKGHLKNCDLYERQITDHRQTVKGTYRRHDPRRDGFGARKYANHPRPDEGRLSGEGPPS